MEEHEGENAHLRDEPHQRTPHTPNQSHLSKAGSRTSKGKSIVKDRVSFLRSTKPNSHTRRHLFSHFLIGQIMFIFSSYAWYARYSPNQKGAGKSTFY